MLDINVRNFITIGLLSAAALAIMNTFAAKMGIDIDLDDEGDAVHSAYSKRR